MALPVQPTLAEITSEVLAAIAEGGTGVASANTIAQVEVMARRAQATLYQQAVWTINRVRQSVVLAGSSVVTGTQTIDWPDSILPGHITRVTATRVSDPRYEWSLEAGISPEDRSVWNFGGFQPSTMTPYKWDILNGLIELGPVNKSDVNIWMQGDAAPSKLMKPDDRPGCDGEAVIRLTEILLRNAMGGDYRAGISALKDEYQTYLDSIKPRQGTARAIVPGSVWAVDDPARPSNWVTSRQRHWLWRSRRP